ncbi:MAG TPA: UDP-N-acetylmuramyl-tripeptide synthetase [Polyangiaceae bacterium]|nr:UDP-N-acetylmuramyl-tripeptide synthetase [Polyangiaceae bacterium]
MTDVRPPPAAPPWADSLFTVGVTGTNGKTSTTAMIARLLGALCEPVARVTTVGSFLAEERLDVPAHYDGFLETMRRCLAAGGRYAAVELTSEALALGFAKAWPCRVGVFTNLSLDHSDAHGSAEHYLASKAQLFMALRPGGVAVLNARDAAAELLSEVVPPGVELVRYGLPSRGAAWAVADLSAHSVQASLAGTRFELEPSERFPKLPHALKIRAIGEIFVENALAALAAALAAGVAVDDAVARLAHAAPPAGRFQVVHEQPCVVIDYAHTPDALARTLATARQLCAGRLSVVFGAGGQRDRAKRPLLGAAAASADRVVLTSDNPRDEEPAAIIAQIAAGLAGHQQLVCEVDRARAIEFALRAAAPTDLILIAGKGHEQSQETAGIRRPFSDEAIVQRVSESDTHTRH